MKTESETSEIDSGDALLQAWNSMTSTPDPVIEYRWYYDEDGNITVCSTCNHPESGQYIVVDAAMFPSNASYTIVDGKPKAIEHKFNQRAQFRKSSSGYPVAKNNAALIVESTEKVDQVEYYAKRIS